MAREKERNVWALFGGEYLRKEGSKGGKGRVGAAKVVRRGRRKRMRLGALMAAWPTLFV